MPPRRPHNKVRITMNNRRDFLKTAAAGAVLLSSNSKMGLAATLDAHTGSGKSKFNQ